MKTCKIEYTCQNQVHQKSKLNQILIKVFTNYVNALSTLLFFDSDCSCGSNKHAMGIMIHK